MSRSNPYCDCRKNAHLHYITSHLGLNSFTMDSREPTLFRRSMSCPSNRSNQVFVKLDNNISYRSSVKRNFRNNAELSATLMHCHAQLLNDFFHLLRHSTSDIFITTVNNAFHFRIRELYIIERLETPRLMSCD